MVCQLENESEPFIHLNNLQFISTMISQIEVTTVDILSYAIYLRKYLDILCRSSCMDRYAVLKENVTLLRKTIGTAEYCFIHGKEKLFLISDILTFIYECGQSGAEEFKPVSKLSEFDEETNDFRIHGLKRDLIRLIANLVHKNANNQLIAKDVLPIILNHTQVDARNPCNNLISVASFKKKINLILILDCQNWAIVAIRNLLEDNDENKSFLSSLSLQEISQDVNDFRKYGIEAELVDGKVVVKNIN